jgi:hypothetical protein
MAGSGGDRSWADSSTSTKRKPEAAGRCRRNVLEPHTVGQLARLDARHRAHARVEDRIRCAKDTGLHHFPSRSFAINQAWLCVVMLAVDLIAWTQHLLLSDDLAKAEPKTLRYRLLHVAARLTHGQRLWVPRTVSPSLISTFSRVDSQQHRAVPAQHDRSSWPSDSST